MLKQYRRRFVAANMALVGAVLLVTFAALVFLTFRSARDELENTMRLVLRPWDLPGEGFTTLDRPEPPQGEPPAGEPGDRPGGEWESRQERDRLMTDDRDVLTVFYDDETGQISILSDDSGQIDAAGIGAAVRQALAEESAFGRLREMGLFYYRESTGKGHKIALAPTGYLWGRVGRNVLLLAVAFLGALGLFLLISIRLARVAARPMEEAVDMERRFVADLSHDLKTPITVVLANNSILRSNPDATVAEQRQWIDSTDQAAKSMMELVGEMLTLSSLESVERKVELRSVSLSDAAEKSVLQLESLAYERGVTVDSDLAPDVSVSATPEMLERICGGLIENALKYEPAGGRALVRLTRERKKAVFTVQNPGSVVPPEDLAHLFERFYRGDKARAAHQGHGMGLSIIRQITELIGARIRADSSPGTGTLFTVTFDVTEK